MPYDFNSNSSMRYDIKYHKRQQKIGGEGKKQKGLLDENSNHESISYQYKLKGQPSIGQLVNQVRSK